MSITESLRRLAEAAADKSLKEGHDMVQIETAGKLILVKSGSEEGRKRKEQSGCIADILVFKENEFYICNW